ncbi:MAG: F0F1 ATP synthase subunit epsilon [Clostridiales bacterium]|nr:F0F1 ATP synthase subunit epsilon [Clostridiales bacterium]
MAAMYMLEIVTPDRNFYSGDAEMTIVRTTTGDMGILKDHEPTVAPLSIGVIKIKIGNEVKIAACSSGFVNIDDEAVTIVTDAAEWAEEIDIDRAKAALERAKERLDAKQHEIDMYRAQISMTRALNRVRTAESKMDHTNL